MAARAPFTAFFDLVVGVLQLGIGTLLAAWSWVTHVDTARGFDAVRWLVVNTPLPWTDTPTRIANMAIQDGGRWAAGFAGAVLVGLSLANFWRVRRNLLPANASTDGKMRLDLAAPARLGCWLEGQVALLRGAQAGDAYDVSLRCARRVLAYRASSSSSDGRESYYRDDVRYEQRVHSRAVAAAAGLAVPFRFEVPADMPPEGSGGAVRWMQFHWSLAAGRPAAIFPARFPLDMRALAAGESGNRIAASGRRDWTHVQPTRVEAALRARAEAMFDKAGRAIVAFCAVSALLLAGLFIVFVSDAVMAFFD